MTVKKTKKAFRELLNKESEGLPKHKHGRFNQQIRAYGDYLYNQDRDHFNMLYNQWATQ